MVKAMFSVENVSLKSDKLGGKNKTEIQSFYIWKPLKLRQSTWKSLHTSGTLEHFITLPPQTYACTIVFIQYNKGQRSTRF